MKVQEMIELVLHQSPIDDGNIAEIYLKDALQEFCRLTEIVRKEKEIVLDTKSLTQVLDDDEIISIRGIKNQEGVVLVGSAMPSLLQPNVGFWSVENNSPLTLRIGFWNGSEEYPFEEGTALRILYSAQVPLVGLDEHGAKDYSSVPEIPESFISTVVSRASEKANFAFWPARSYFYSVWNNQMKEAKKYANQMNTNSEWNVRVHEL